MKHSIEIQHVKEYWSQWADEGIDTVRVLVDGKEIGRGTYGGEPEDNTRSRQYSWVEPLLGKLSEELDATISYTQTEEDMR